MFYGVVNEGFKDLLTKVGKALLWDKESNTDVLEEVKPGIKIFGKELRYIIKSKEDLDKLEEYKKQNREDAKLINTKEKEVREKSADLWNRFIKLKLNIEGDIKPEDIEFNMFVSWNIKSNTYNTATYFKGLGSGKYKDLPVESTDDFVIVKAKVTDGKVDINVDWM
jgi:hypothetical protein